MVGAVIIAHQGFAEGLVGAVDMILGGHDEGLWTVAVMPEDKPESLVRRITEAVEEAKKAREGVLILTDMFGGTPTNIGMRFVEEGRVELITGVNLPMVLKFITHREASDLGELARLLRHEGRRSIHLAGEILDGTETF